MDNIEPIEGFNDNRDHLLNRLLPLIDELILTKMKLAQLRSKGIVGQSNLGLTMDSVVSEIVFILKTTN